MIQSFAPAAAVDFLLNNFPKLDYSAWDLKILPLAIVVKVLHQQLLPGEKFCKGYDYMRQDEVMAQLDKKDKLKKQPDLGFSLSTPQVPPLWYSMVVEVGYSESWQDLENGIHQFLHLYNVPFGLFINLIRKSPKLPQPPTGLPVFSMEISLWHASEHRWDSGKKRFHPRARVQKFGNWPQDNGPTQAGTHSFKLPLKYFLHYFVEAEDIAKDLLPPMEFGLLTCSSFSSSF